MLERLPGAARKVLERMENEPESGATRPADISAQAALLLARQRYLAFTGVLALASSAWCLAQQIGPVWLGWCIGGLAVLLLIAGRPRRM
jgi:hypothetical protein